MPKRPLAAHDCMDGGDRATQGAVAENAGFAGGPQG